MHPRRTFWTLSAFVLLLGAAFAVALAPLPTVLGSSSGPGGGEASGGNETKPPSNDTSPPANGTNETLPAPELSPENQSLRGSVGQTLAFEVVVTNPAKESQAVAVSVHAPLGWRASVGPSNATLGPKDSLVLSGTVRSDLLLASSGTVRVHVQGHDAGDDAFLDVCFGSLLQPCPPPAGSSTNPNGTKPPANETQPPSNETRPPGNETQPPKNETRPPGNETQPPRNETKPPANETQPPQNDTQEAPAPAQATAAPLVAPEAEVSLRAEDGPVVDVLDALRAPRPAEVAGGEEVARAL